MKRWNALINGQSGSALLAAVLVTLLASALSVSLMADALADARMTLMELERESAFRAAQSMLRLAVAQFGGYVRAHSPANWDVVLLGPDGSRAICTPSDLNPVPPSEAARANLGTLHNRCDDDGTLPATPGDRPLVGKAGLLALTDSSGRLRLLPLPDGHSCGNCADPSHAAADFQVWYKLSDNPEVDGNPAHDSDGVALLRIVVARRYRNAPAGLLPARGPIHAVVTLEAWLQLAAGGTLRVIAVREILL
jgi:hypothetical protein